MPSLTVLRNRAVLCRAVCLGQVDYQGTVLDFEQPFRRATMNDLVKEACGGCMAVCCRGEGGRGCCARGRGGCGRRACLHQGVLRRMAHLFGWALAFACPSLSPIHPACRRCRAVLCHAVLCCAAGLDVLSYGKDVDRVKQDAAEALKAPTSTLASDDRRKALAKVGGGE